MQRGLPPLRSAHGPAPGLQEHPQTCACPIPLDFPVDQRSLSHSQRLKNTPALLTSKIRSSPVHTRGPSSLAHGEVLDEGLHVSTIGREEAPGNLRGVLPGLDARE